MYKGHTPLLTTLGIDTKQKVLYYENETPKQGSVLARKGARKGELQRLLINVIVILESVMTHEVVVRFVKQGGGV